MCNCLYRIPILTSLATYSLRVYCYCKIHFLHYYRLCISLTLSLTIEYFKAHLYLFVQSYRLIFMQTTISITLYELVCAFVIGYNIVVFDDYDNHFPARVDVLIWDGLSECYHTLTNDRLKQKLNLMFYKAMNHLEWNQIRYMLIFFFFFLWL